MLEKEQAKLKKQLEEKEIIAYKTAKVLLRSLPLRTPIDSTKINEFSLSQTDSRMAKISKIDAIVQFLLSNVVYENSNSIDIEQMMKIYSEFNNLRKELSGINEDELPTVLEVFTGILKTKKSNELDSVWTLSNWNSPIEHSVLALMIDKAKLSPGFSLYETSLIAGDKMSNNSFKILSLLLKSIVFSDHEYLYLSQKELNTLIELLETNKIKLGENNDLLFGKNSISFFTQKPINSVETIQTEIHAITYALRGYVRMKMDTKVKDKQADADFEVVVQDLEKLSVENELKWSLKSYLMIKKGDKEKALPELEKLLKSPMMGEKEQKAIKLMIELLKKDDKEGALKLSSKIGIITIMYKYIQNYASKTEFVKTLQTSTAYQKMMVVPNKIEQLRKASSNSIDDFKNKALDLLK